MNAETYAEWLRRQGQQVLRTPSSYWHNGGMRVYQAFPYHWLIEPSRAELSDIFSRHRAVGVRYTMPLVCSNGCPSYSIVFEGGKYDLERLGHRTRKNVRRGLRNCNVEPISFQRLVNEGWELRRDTLDRQGRHVNVTLESWRRRYLAAADFAGFQAWGAYAGSRLAAYLITFQMDDCVSVVDQQSHRDYLDLNVNNAITFVVSQNAAAQPGVRLLFYGLESLDAPLRVSEFKFHMGYTAKPLRQRVVLRPQIAAFANKLSYQVVSKMAEWLPGNRRFAKAKGMLRVCLNERNSPAN
jgi:hypothetical protein